MNFLIICVGRHTDAEYPRHLHYLVFSGLSSQLIYAKGCVDTKEYYIAV